MVLPELQTGFLPVTGGHTIYYEVYGHSTKPPLLLIHGGPGGGIQRRSIPLYKKFCLITFDQRGCGKSTPFGSLKNNTTWDLVDDIEALRKHLGIEKWFVSGGSWGTTLGLLYAETYPERVRGMLLHSVCLIDDMSNKWLYERGGRARYTPRLGPPLPASSLLGYRERDGERFYGTTRRSYRGRKLIASPVHGGDGNTPYRFYILGKTIRLNLRFSH